MDECFEVLTLMQTGKATIYPLVMIDEPGGSYWKTFARFLREHLLRLELISEEDLDFFTVTADEGSLIGISAAYGMYLAYLIAKA